MAANIGGSIESGSRSVIVSIPYNAPAAVIIGFVADRAYRVSKLLHSVLAAGTDGGAVAGACYKAPSGTALGSGTTLQAATTDLKSTANTNTTVGLSLTTTALAIAAGDRVGIVTTGTTTAATGCFTMILDPVDTNPA